MELASPVPDVCLSQEYYANILLLHFKFSDFILHELCEDLKTQGTTIRMIMG